MKRVERNTDFLRLILIEMLPQLFPAQTASVSLRLGDLMIVGIPGEMAASLGLQIKAAAQQQKTVQSIRSSAAWRMNGSATCFRPMNMIRGAMRRASVFTDEHWGRQLSKVLSRAWASHLRHDSGNSALR